MNVQDLGAQSIFLKVLGILSCICLFISTITIAVSSPETRYEISIYEAYPQYFWYALVIAIICGILILLVTSLILKRKNKLWILGLGVVTLANSIIILLPFFRGYHIAASGDEISHIGYLKDIALTHHFGLSNYYPLNHIFAYDLTAISGLNTFTVLFILPLFFYLIYLMGIYLVSKKLEKGEGGLSVILTMAFASPLLFTYFNYLYLPTHFFLELVPLIIYILFQSNNLGEGTLRGKNFSILLTIFLVVTPFIHPLGSLFLIGILVLFKSAILLHKILINHIPWKKPSDYFRPISITIPLLITSTILLVWFTKFSLFRYTSEKATIFFSTFEGISPISETTDTLGSSGLSHLEIVRLIFTNYGHIFIFTVLIISALLIILLQLYREKAVPNFLIIFLGIMYVSFSLFYIATLLGDFFITGRSIRIYCWALVPGIILCGIVYHPFIKAQNRSSKKIFTMIVSILILIAAIIGIFSIFFSPYVLQGDPHISYKEWSGITWFFTEKEEYDTLYFDQTPYRAPFALYGLDGEKPSTTGFFFEAPKHLGYDIAPSISNIITSDAYIMLSERVRIAKTQLWPDRGIFTLEELNQLYVDDGVNKIFENEDLDIFYIHQKG